MNYKLKIKKINAGYTIIETMIAISLFLIIVTIGMGSLLNANFVHRKSQDMRSIMDNLSFIMEDMSRNLRTGYSYHCGNSLSGVDTPLSCPLGDGLIAFESANGSSDDPNDQWVYQFILSDDGTYYNIEKSVDSGVNFVQLNPEEVKIDANSIFTVIGAETYSVDTIQPFVTIRLSGAISSRSSETPIPFSLQTSVSQRLIDIQASQNPNPPIDEGEVIVAPPEL